jgi:hypothetical protein
MKDVLVWAMCNARVKDDFVKMFCLPLSENRLVTLPTHPISEKAQQRTLLVHHRRSHYRVAPIALARVESHRFTRAQERKRSHSLTLLRALSPSFSDALFDLLNTECRPNSPESNDGQSPTPNSMPTRHRESADSAESSSVLRNGVPVPRSGVLKRGATLPHRGRGSVPSASQSRFPWPTIGRSGRVAPSASHAFDRLSVLKNRSIVDGLFAPETNKLATTRMQALYAWAGYTNPVMWETSGRKCMNGTIAALLNLNARTLVVVGHTRDASIRSMVERKNCA